MKKIFTTNSNPTATHIVLLIVRVSVALFMMTHGLPKLSKLLAGETGFSDPFGLGGTTSLILAILAEILCSLLLLIGLATRLACIPLLITMGVAAFMSHADDPFATKEKALLYLLIYLVILVMGAGKYSIDQMIGGGKR